MVDVPVCQADLLFDIIEGAVSLWVFPFVGKFNNFQGKILDAPCVVCDCHGIAPKNKLKGVGAAGLHVRS